MSRETRTTKVYVGGLPNDARKEELENEFSRFGKLQDVWVARNPPGFAFIEFYDERDAKDACFELDGRTVCGQRVRVELSHGKTRGRGRGRGGYDRRDDRRDDRGRRYEDSRGSRYFSVEMKKAKLQKPLTISRKALQKLNQKDKREEKFLAKDVTTFAHPF
ncbi:RNA-binding protein 1-like [Xenia sp. Carnegie-2017]|uniref:RNA-binding protein 1-like n=1 Tax=Xenia sp. Carnegie-2017 TaxID=2897299 RepID=UPI001F043BEF|nr:RNA-binding protein 1-like [Xenia sp. Carnegie-2017]